MEYSGLHNLCDIYVKIVYGIILHYLLLLPIASFDMKISVDGLFFIGS